MEKLVKISRVIDIIVKISRGICIGVAVAAVILFVIGLALPASQYEQLVSASDMSVDLGSVKLELARPLEPSGDLRTFVCLSMVSGAAAAALAAWCLTLFHKVLKPMSEGQPFGGAVSGTLRKLGWMTLFGGIAIDVLSYVVTRLEVGLYDLNEVFAPGLISGCTVEYVSSGLVAPVVILLLSLVFKYGEELQRQSDETL